MVQAQGSVVKKQSRNAIVKKTSKKLSITFIRVELERDKRIGRSSPGPYRPPASRVKTIFSQLAVGLCGNFRGIAHCRIRLIPEIPGEEDGSSLYTGYPE